MKDKILNILVCICLLSFMSCNDDFLDHNPSDEVSSDVLLDTEGSIEAAMNGLYYNLSNPKDYDFSLYQMGFAFVNEVRADDVMSNDGVWNNLFYEAYTYNSSKADNLGPYIWNYSYFAIDQCNVIINDGLLALDDEDKRKDYIAQAKAIRAMVYWDLVSVFARPYIVDNGASPGVPLITLSEHGKSNARGTVKAIYDQIFKDLTEALADIGSESDKLRVNEAMINGMLARYYLDLGDYAKAMSFAEEAVGIVGPMSANELRYGLSGTPSESMLTLVNTENAWAPYRTHATYWDDYDGMGRDIRIPIEFAEQFAYDDIRRDFFWSQYNWKKWAPYYADAYESAQQDNFNWSWPDRLYMYGKFPRLDFKCSDIEAYVRTGDHSYVSEWGSVGLGNYTYMRSSEMVLVVAECAARLASPQTAKAQEWLHKIQSRAIEGAPVSSNTGQALIDEIMLEKRKELLGEGHRMRDILRLRQDIQRPASTWTSKDFISKDDPKILLPIPDTEIKVNELINEEDQNPGYK